MDRYEEFLSLHVPGKPLLLANAWDIGTAKVLHHLGFAALATTSAGFAATLGRHDGDLSRDEAIVHAAQLAAATPLPLNADLEHCYAADGGGVSETLRLAAAAGVAGASIEDWDPVTESIYPIDVAVERVGAAVDAAHRGTRRVVITARAENHLHDIEDLDDTIRRLQAYSAAGADVLYAPALRTVAAIERVVNSVDRPVNVLALPGVPPVEELAKIGVARVSVGSGFSLAALGALVDAGRELLDHGTYGFWDVAALGVASRLAFG